MLCFQLVCECGYQSDVACWGEKPWSGHQMVLMPIYEPDTGHLSSQEFPAREGDAKDDDFEAWMDKYGGDIRRSHGSNAKVLIPAVYDTPFMTCPKCDRHTCQAISAGIV
jgi:hypothetical protein